MPELGGDDRSPGPRGAKGFYDWGALLYRKSKPGEKFPVKFEP
ncbi:MAG TPA: hypothetical protein VJV79_17920 [Polyangiaceae bacterium]|nr:hypothetical protein [Polyangiaceae bacterium]